MKIDFIFRFIHALDQGELRSCRNELELDTSDLGKFRLLLFEALAVQSTYDWEVLQHSFSAHKMRSQLSVEKNRLLESLMAILTSVRRKKEHARCPWLKLEDARMLLSMGLLNDAVDTIQEGLLLAMAIQDVFAELQLREMLREAYKSIDRKALQLQIMENDQKLEATSSKVTNLITYTLINDRMLDYHMRYRAVAPEQVMHGVDQLMAQPEMQSINQATSLPAQLRYYHIQALYDRMNNRMPQAVENYTHLVALWETNTERMEYYAHFYRRAVANLIGVLTISHHYEQVPHLLARMENIQVTGQRSKVLHFTDIELQHQLFYLNTGQLENVFAREQNVKKGINQYGKAIGESYAITLQYNLAVAHLLNDDTGNALHYFNRIREMGICQERIDLQGIARLFRLALLMHDKTNTNFQHFLRNSKRFFVDDHQLHAMEEVIYAWITQHSKLEDNATLLASFQMLYNKLQPFEEHHMAGAEEFRFYAYANAHNVKIRSLFNQDLKRKGII